VGEKSEQPVMLKRQEALFLQEAVSAVQPLSLTALAVVLVWGLV
jgi:hypothetical protein